MSQTEQDFTIGVEEEYQIVHRNTRELRPRAENILARTKHEAGGEVMPELYLSQIEIGTPVCRSLADMRDELVRLRGAVIRAAERDGNRIVAAGTHPFSHWEDQEVTPKARYLSIWQDHQQLAREQIIFGCHVHVGISDPETAIQVMNRVRPHLHVLLALTGNSPFWLGADTGYNSFRTEIWRRWAMAGTPQVFRNRAEYDRLVEVLVKTESVSDASKIYWDVRPASRFPTLEFRVTDVCLSVDEAVMVAGLCRALAQTCHAEASADKHIEHVRPELLRAAEWRAARYGLDADLIDVANGCARPAREVVEQLLAYLRDALEANGDWTEVSHTVNEILERGNGATRQRAAYASGESYEAVVDYAADETARGVLD